MDIGKLLKEGFAHIEEEHAAAEKLKLGILRGGNSGLADISDGQVGITGTCHRKTYLRYKGIVHDEIDADRNIMFGGGRFNEDMWMDLLTRSYPHKILRESEIPVSWKTTNGTLVTGRPDIVLCDKKDKPKLGLELKMASSIWTVREVINGRPKQPHLIQCAHYSWQLGIPFQLWYTAYVDFAVTGWTQKHFPNQGEKGSEYCVYNEKGEIVKVLPFQIGFETDWRKGTLWFKEAGKPDAEWQETIVSHERIKRYYDFVSTMDESDSLGPRPENLKFSGEKMSWKFCDNKYCKLASVCDKHESRGTKAWTEAVKEFVAQNKTDVIDVTEGE